MGFVPSRRYHQYCNKLDARHRLVTLLCYLSIKSAKDQESKAWKEFMHYVGDNINSKAW